MTIADYSDSRYSTKLRCSIDPLPAYIDKKEKAEIEPLHSWKEGSNSASLFWIFTQIASSSAYYYYGAVPLVKISFLHAFQSLCPFYIPVLKQSALEQSRLLRTLLLHRDSYNFMIMCGCTLTILERYHHKS